MVWCIYSIDIINSILNGATVSCYRNPPLRIAITLPVHKGQGLTLNQVVLNLERMNHDPRLPYVENISS